jgi:hypothetical protein
LIKQYETRQQGFTLHVMELFVDVFVLSCWKTIFNAPLVVYNQLITSVKLWKLYSFLSEYNVLYEF